MLAYEIKMYYISPLKLAETNKTISAEWKPELCYSLIKTHLIFRNFNSG
jgi:hypothetical protein